MRGGGRGRTRGLPIVAIEVKGDGGCSGSSENS